MRRKRKVKKILQVNDEDNNKISDENKENEIAKKSSRITYQDVERKLHQSKHILF